MIGADNIINSTTKNINVGLVMGKYDDNISIPLLFLLQRYVVFSKLQTMLAEKFMLFCVRCGELEKTSYLCTKKQEVL